MATLLDLARPALMLGGFVLVLRLLWLMTLGAMVRLGRPRGALVPLWTLAILAAGYALTPVQPVYTPVIDVTEMVDGILRALETMEPPALPAERTAFDPLATLMRVVHEPPWGLWAALLGATILNAGIVLMRR